MTDPEILRQIHNRLDKQDELLFAIRDQMVAHIAASEDIKPALNELVAIWRGSKLLIPILSGLVATVWAVISWAKEHLK